MTVTTNNKSKAVISQFFLSFSQNLNFNKARFAYFLVRDWNMILRWWNIYVMASLETKLNLEIKRIGKTVHFFIRQNINNGRFFLELNSIWHHHHAFLTSLLTARQIKTCQLKYSNRKILGFRHLPISYFKEAFTLLFTKCFLKLQYATYM